MRLLLDAQLSPKRIGSALERRGHDVLCLALDPVLRALDDPDVLELAARERRVLVTRNARDFAPLLRQWAELDRHHAGCILVWTLGHHQFARIVAGVDALLSLRRDPRDWHDLTVAL